MTEEEWSLLDKEEKIKQLKLWDAEAMKGCMGAMFSPCKKDWSKYEMYCCNNTYQYTAQYCLGHFNQKVGWMTDICYAKIYDSNMKYIKTHYLDRLHEPKN